MKFLAALILLVASIATAQDKTCEADYIVTRCLQTENDKVTACNQTDFNCLCASYQAIATCYNNCPNDARAPSAHAQVTAYCRNPLTTTAAAAVPSSSTSSASSSTYSSSVGLATDIDGPTPTTSTGFVNGTPTSDSATHKNCAGVVLFVAGIAGILALP
ncbi:hypothetical protein MY5147_008289 [Beauveria neobassiana]|uniref:GPI anchored serine-threonine rich protein n=1 Tax=Beauveria bassiana D1-5 TaxID=1245745 RepID=A0A0A2VCB5_BEABA|nr:hypothetical protein BBAD15_g11078 [Beauveria bassiana D1-5]